MREKEAGKNKRGRRRVRGTVEYSIKEEEEEEEEEKEEKEERKRTAGSSGAPPGWRGSAGRARQKGPEGGGGPRGGGRPS